MKIQPNEKTARLSRNLTAPGISVGAFGLAIGSVSVLFYLGCIVTMATVPREHAINFFNGLLRGLDVGPIFRGNVPLTDAVLGLISTFILGWFGGALAAAVYNGALSLGRQDG